METVSEARCQFRRRQILESVKKIQEEMERLESLLGQDDITESVLSWIEWQYPFSEPLEDMVVRVNRWRWALADRK